MQAGMMPVAPLGQPPIPLVKTPRVHAPASARDPKAYVPSPFAGEKEPLVEGVMERLPLPDFIKDPVFKGVTLINRVVFKSDPPGKPVPEQKDAWHFSAIGDYGFAGKALTDVTNNIARSNPDLVLTLGDNVYWSGTEKEFQGRWDPPKAFGDIHKNFPVMPSLGNHDVKDDPNATPYFNRFPQLKNARYYAYDHGGVHFVSLNSNEDLKPGSEQYKWLESDLAKTKQDWKVVYFHHPMVSAYRLQKAPLNEFIGPLMAKYGVSLVMAGHEHNYTRTKPLNDSGTVEIVSGGGGHTLYPFTNKMGPKIAYRDVDWGHVNVEVQKDKLVGRYVVRDGTVRDTFVIEKPKPQPKPAE